MHRIMRSVLLVALFVLAAMPGYSSSDPSLMQTGAATKKSPKAAPQTVDHFVSHISTIPANEGEEVELFLRERFLSDDERKRKGKSQYDDCGQNGPLVLMVHGNSISTVPSFDVDFENYSWMSYLAEHCFDVFAVDLQDYGLSARPKMDDPCNASLAD